MNGKVPRFAHGKTELAKLCGISRTWLYRYMREPSFPSPRADGRWPVEAVRRFVRKCQVKVETPNEREQLEIELLRKRIRKVDVEIADLTNERAEAITNEITGLCRKIVGLLQGQLSRMPDEFSGLFNMQGTAREIYNIWKGELNRRFRIAYSSIEKIEKAHARKSNVIPFEQKKIAVAA
jgi:predicted DNA-binding transcriptional regulator AlpA